MNHKNKNIQQIFECYKKNVKRKKTVATEIHSQTNKKKKLVAFAPHLFYLNSQNINNNGIH